MIYLAGGPAERADLSRGAPAIAARTASPRRRSSMSSRILTEGKWMASPLVAEGDVIIIVHTKWFDGKTLLTILNNTLLLHRHHSSLHGSVQ